VARSPHSIVHRKSTVVAETRRYEVSEMLSVALASICRHNLQGIQNSFICDFSREAIKSMTEIADSLSNASRYCRASEPVDLESLRVAFTD
jgi:predicted lipoprotein